MLVTVLRSELRDSTLDKVMLTSRSGASRRFSVLLVSCRGLEDDALETRSQQGRILCGHLRMPAQSSNRHFCLWISKRNFCNKVKEEELQCKHSA